MEAGRLYQQQDVEALEALAQRIMAPLPGDGRLRLTPMTDVKMRAVSWLWKNRIARGELHLIGGEGGEGKSAMVLDWIARLTRGEPWPDGSPGSERPERVVILSAEDAAEHTIKPRLRAAGADMTKMHVLDSKGAAGLSLVENLVWLEREMVRIQATVLVVDSINDFLPKLDIHRINEVKSALGTWTSLAARHHLVIIGITHLNKNREGSAAQRFIGSVGFINQARLSFLVAADSEDVDRKRKLLVAVKNNVGALAPTLAFRKYAVFLKPENGVRTKIETVKLAWTRVKEPVDATTLLRKLQAPIRPRDMVAIILKKKLRQGPLLADTILDAVRAAGATEKTARRMKDKLRIGSVQRGGRWYWTPPGWTSDQITAWRQDGSRGQSDAHTEK